MKTSSLILIKIGLATLLFMCLLNMPYGYYQFIRHITFLFFTISGINLLFKSSRTFGLICIGIGLLFQPFIKVALGREIWNIVDVIVGIGLLLSLRYSYFEKAKTPN